MCVLCYPKLSAYRIENGSYAPMVWWRHSRPWKIALESSRWSSWMACNPPKRVRIGCFVQMLRIRMRKFRVPVFVDYCCFRAANHLRDLTAQLAHLDRSSSLTIDKEHFQANIDVQQFQPEEISVRLLDDHSVKVEAKHEELQDDHGFISR